MYRKANQQRSLRSNTNNLLTCEQDTLESVLFAFLSTLQNA
jgi:hypothetical protein